MSINEGQLNTDSLTGIFYQLNSPLFSQIVVGSAA